MQNIGNCLIKSYPYQMMAPSALTAISNPSAAVCPKVSANYKDNEGR